MALLTSLGESAAAHVRVILAKTSDPALRNQLLDSPHTVGLFEPSPGKQMCKVLFQTHPGAAFSTVLRNLMQENDGKSVYSSLLSFGTPLGQVLRTLAPADAADPFNPLHLCTALKDTDKGWSRLVDADATPAAASAATGYLQARY